MPKGSQFRSVFVAVFAVLALIAAAESSAQHNNPYRAYYGWAKLPEGRNQGVVAGIYADPDGQHMWLMDRCGGNNCAGVDVDPILKFDLQGNFVKSFGKGLFGWPHGFFVDHEGNLWVTEGSPAGERRGEAGFKTRQRAPGLQVESGGRGVDDPGRSGRPRGRRDALQWTVPCAGRAQWRNLGHGWASRWQ